MIISASRRTDIPSYYSEWFFNRIKDGYAYVRNPMNPHMISKISLSPDVVDGIVFWTKNPAPMLHRLEELRDYTYYFQFTLTPYGTDTEKNIPSKNDFVIPAFRKLSSLIGRERVIWRYDPIMLNERYTMRYHKKYFRMLCERLADYTEKCTISFLDLYINIRRSIAESGIRAPTVQEAEELTEYFAAVSKEHGIFIDTCAESIDLGKYGAAHACCIDKNRLERIGGYSLRTERDKNQRAACECAASIDIGAYSTCRNGCVYCYAGSRRADRARLGKHNPSSPLLDGDISDEDIVTPREMHSLRDGQISLFDDIR